MKEKVLAKKQVEHAKASFNSRRVNLTEAKYFIIGDSPKV